MIVHCTWRFGVTNVPSQTDLVEECDRIMRCLLDLEAADPGLADAAVALDSAQMQVEISISAQGKDYREGLLAAMSAIRAGIHAAGGSTPRWPTVDVIAPTDTPASGGDRPLIFREFGLVAEPLAG